LFGLKERHVAGNPKQNNKTPFTTLTTIALANTASAFCLLSPEGEETYLSDEDSNNYLI
jgi:hypothetical protein